MKKLLFGLVSLFLASQFFISCSSDTNVLSQFSKRKYLKKYNGKKIRHKDDINTRDNSINYEVATAELASNNKELDIVTLTETGDNDLSIEAAEVGIKSDEENLEKIELVNKVSKDYSDWNLYNRKVDFSKSYNVNKHEKQILTSTSNNPVVLAILSIFIPPLAVYLNDGSITNNFWVDLLLTLLFWFPGVIFSLLVCFGGVSI